MITRRAIAIASTAVAVLTLAVQARATPHFGLCSATEYHSLVERRMREALTGEVGPLIVRYALPIWTEIAVGVTRGTDGFHLVRLEFDRSLYYDSWVELDEVPDDVDLSDLDSVAEVIYREDGGPLGIEFQDFSRVDPRVAITSIPVSDELANALSELLNSFGPAGESEQSDVIIIDGPVIELFQTSGRCLNVGPSLTGESAAEALIGLFGFLTGDMSEWRALSKHEFEAEVFARIREIQAPQ